MFVLMMARDSNVDKNNQTDRVQTVKTEQESKAGLREDQSESEDDSHWRTYNCTALQTQSADRQQETVVWVNLQLSWSEENN